MAKFKYTDRDGDVLSFDTRDSILTTEHFSKGSCVCVHLSQYAASELAGFLARNFVNGDSGKVEIEE